MKEVWSHVFQTFFMSKLLLSHLLSATIFQVSLAFMRLFQLKRTAISAVQLRGGVTKRLYAFKLVWKRSLIVDADEEEYPSG